jgi:60 kDa SS-A/Ro ribonucleoprotein
MTAEIPMGGTDCALPMIYARENNIPVDVFVIYTDSETWYNRAIHPVQALREYRKAMDIAAKLIVVGLVANNFSIADPNDAGMLDVVGFDSAAPGIMSDFARGRV